jgi:hypothetical protein
MTRPSERGVKRRCQNESCGLPFYDLNRTDFSCPTCGSAFEIPPDREPGAVRERRPYRRQFPAVQPDAITASDAASDAEVVAAPSAVPFDDADGPQDDEAILEPDDGSDNAEDIISDRDADEEA